MTIEVAKCKTCWTAFVNSLEESDPRRRATPDAFAFGGGGDLADELAALVLAGSKRATTSLPLEYTSLNEPLPKRGDLSIILDGRGFPVAIIERVSVDLVPFRMVDAAFAAQEGEGDGSLEDWREAHGGYFNEVCLRLGGEFDGSTAVLCQTFEVVWPRIAIERGGDDNAAGE